jgi:pyrrolidone-carboxylate peptidase
VSDDAGHYLCEYIYFRSMEETAASRIPVLFCHVPCPGKPFNVSEMTKFFEILIGEMVDNQEEFVYYTPPRSPTGEILS